MATTNYQEATMATTATKAPTKAKKATREFWISRDSGSDYVQVWPGKAEPKVSTAPRNNCQVCNDPDCWDNRPLARFAQRGIDAAVASECVTEFQRVTGIKINKGEALLVRMTVVKRS